MNQFEEKLKAATAKDSGYMLGAIGLVTDADGTVLYHHADGRQDIESDNVSIDRDSATWAGKDSEEKFVVCEPNKAITIRHLLTHTAGIDTGHNELVQEYLSENPLNISEDAPVLVKLFSMPLLFHPGESFLYGCCVYWLQHLINVLGGNFQAFVEDNIFKPLGMKNVTYTPEKIPEVWEKKLRMVEKVEGKFVPHDQHSRGHTCSPIELSKLFADITSPDPKLLQKAYCDMLLEGQFARGSGAQIALFELEDNYGFAANKSDQPDINFTALGVYLANSDLRKSGIPKGSIFMDGAFGTVWAANKEKGLVAIFATQLLPYGASDDVMLTFMRDAFSTFSKT